MYGKFLPKGEFTYNFEMTPPKLLEIIQMIATEKIEITNPNGNRSQEALTF